MMKRASHREIHTTNGRLIDSSSLDLPFEIEMYAGAEYGYDQYAPDFDGEVVAMTLEERLHDYYDLPSMMTPKLVDAIQSTGVENLQAFPTHITDAQTGETLDKEYLFVNIIGLIPCADLDNSEHSPIGNTFCFHELKLNIQKTNGLSIFRLAESPIEVIVNEQIAEVIKTGNFTGLTVEAVE